MQDSNSIGAIDRINNAKTVTPHLAGQSAPALPLAVYILGFGIFAMVTSELQVSGMLTVMAADLDVSISQIGYLVSVYAFAMAFGGPLLTMALLKKPPKTALLTLYAIFICGESLGALSQSYQMLTAARLVTGSVSGAFFGTALAICVHLVEERQRGWATSFVLAGIMMGTVLGLPIANLIGVHLGWRESFWATTALTTLGALLSIALIPSLSAQVSVSVRTELSALKNARLWLAFSTSLLIIGATFAAFTYFIPILKDVSGYSDSAIACLLFTYGIAGVIGNLVVGKLADRYTLSVLAVGLCLLAAFLAMFGAFADNKTCAAISLIGIGLVGMTMNPAMVARVMRVANGRPLVNTVHTSVITLGIVIGAFWGGLFISVGYGLCAPLWVGFLMALAGLLSLLPELWTLNSKSTKTKL